MVVDLGKVVSSKVKKKRKLLRSASFQAKIEGKKKRNADPPSVNTKAKKQNNLLTLSLRREKFKRFLDTFCKN